MVLGPSRTEDGWWWLDDAADSPLAGRLLVDGGSARWEITAQMTRLARDPALLRRAGVVRLVSRQAPFRRRPYQGGDPARGYARPALARRPAPFATPIDFGALGV